MSSCSQPRSGAFRALLVLGGAPRDVAARAARHGCKRFQQNVGEARESLPETDRPELGRWAGSIAQLQALEPTQQMLRRHELRSSQLPVLYAAEARVGIIRGQTTAIRAVVIEAGGLDNLEWERGWSRFWKH
jgi:hypothetical protein